MLSYSLAFVFIRIFADFPRILSTSLGFWPYSLVYSRVLSDSSYAILSEFIRNISYSYGFSRIPYSYYRIHSDSFSSAQNLTESFRVLRDSFRFFRYLFYPLGIWPNSFVFPPLLVDFFEFSPILSEFDQILLYFLEFFRIFPDSLRISRNLLGFFHVLSYLFGFFRILWDLDSLFIFFGFCWILSNYLWILSLFCDSIAFSRILSHSFGFSRNLAKFSYILSDYFGFFSFFFFGNSWISIQCLFFWTLLEIW